MVIHTACEHIYKSATKAIQIMRNVLLFLQEVQCLNMMLHALLVNPTCLQSLRFWYCSVCEIHELNQRRR